MVRLFSPDITIGTKEQDYSGIYQNVVHELSHASHYAQVGNDYWNPYIEYVIKSFIKGKNAYGTGSEDNAGYCELGEMWGYFMQASLFKDRYGGNLPSYGSKFWFKPDILTYLYERGMSRGEIFRALSADVKNIGSLKERLISLYPEREKAIRETFQQYGK